MMENPVTQNSNKLLCEYRQTDSEICIKRQKAKMAKLNIEKQNWKTNPLQLQDMI